MHYTLLVSALLPIIGSIAIPVPATAGYAAVKELEHGLRKPRAAVVSGGVDNALVRPPTLSVEKAQDLARREAYEKEEGFALREDATS